MVHVSAAPALVARVVVGVVAGALVCDHHHHAGLAVIAHVFAVKPLAIPVWRGKEG